MESKTNRQPGCLFTATIIIVTVVISVAVTIWILTQYVFPKKFDPVELSQSEQRRLDQKLAIFSGWEETSKTETATTNESALEPEPYREDDSKRMIRFSERELNALLANNTDLSERLAIDLSDRLASGKLLIPLDPDFPIMGGKTVKLSAGLELAYDSGQPIVILKGVSIMGVPIPNAWLGGLKNVDLVREFGADEGFWKTFAEGVELIAVEEGKLVIRLKP